MTIEGKIISNKNGTVKIKQFMTGSVYSCELSKIKIYGKNNIPEKTSDGYFIAKVNWEDTKFVRLGSEPSSVDRSRA